MSLIHWLPLMDSSCEDKMGSKLLTTLNKPNFVSNVGKIGGSYQFSNHNIKIENIPVTKTMSFTAWIYFSTVTSCHIIDCRDASGNGYQPLYYDITQGIQVYSSVGCNGNFIATGSLKKETWYHIAIIYNNNTGSLYLNGEYKGSISCGGLNCISNLFLGTRYSAEYPFKGYLNDVRIYDHALSLTEVQELKKALVLHYTFEDELIADGMLYNETGLVQANESSSIELSHEAAIGTYSLSNGANKYFNIDETFINKVAELESSSGDDIDLSEYVKFTDTATQKKAPQRSAR